MRKFSANARRQRFIGQQPEGKAKRVWMGRIVNKRASVWVEAQPRDNQPTTSQNTMLRSEAEAPFRVFRLAAYTALAVSAGLGGAIAFIRVLAGFAKGDIAAGTFLSSEDVRGLGIDLAALFVLLYLYNIDNEARQKQLVRLERESNLSQLKAEIRLKKPRLVRLEQLQGFARMVIIAGSAEYIDESLQSAAELSEMIKDRSICIVPIVMSGPPFEVSKLDSLLPDPNIVLMPILIDQWKDWINDQMGKAGVETSQNVYIGLRLDGRVRASGIGYPPWKKFIAELTPKEGIWGSTFMKGFDGRV